MWLDAVVTQDMCNQVVLGRVRLLTHAALPPFQALTDIHAVRLVDLDVDVQAVYATPTGHLALHWFPPKHPLVVLLKFPDPFHLPTLVPNFTALKVVAHLFPTTSRFHAISSTLPILCYLICCFIKSVCPVA